MDGEKFIAHAMVRKYNKHDDLKKLKSYKEFVVKKNIILSLKMRKLKIITVHISA